VLLKKKGIARTDFKGKVFNISKMVFLLLVYSNKRHFIEIDET
jgi:hypothetical protein